MPRAPRPVAAISGGLGIQLCAGDGGAIAALGLLLVMMSGRKQPEAACALRNNQNAEGRTLLRVFTRRSSFATKSQLTGAQKRSA